MVWNLKNMDSFQTCKDTTIDIFYVSVINSMGDANVQGPETLSIWWLFRISFFWLAMEKFSYLGSNIAGIDPPSSLIIVPQSHNYSLKHKAFKYM